MEQGRAPADRRACSLATVSWTAVIVPLRARPHQQPAQTLCTLRGKWTLQAGCDVLQFPPGTVMRYGHCKGPSHAQHAGAGSLRQSLQMTLPRSPGGVAWQRPGGPASPLPHPLQSPRTPSPAGRTAICLLGLIGLLVPCGILWGTGPSSRSRSAGQRVMRIPQ